MNSKVKLNVFISTLNFVLCFVGYQFVTTLLLPTSSNIEDISRTVTVPYRAFALFVSLLAIVMNWLKPTGILPLALNAFLFYWGILIIRILIDVFIRTDLHLNTTAEIWTYVFGICLPAVISIVKSYKYIDMEKAFWWILIFIAVTLGLTLFSNQAIFLGTDEINTRQQGNLALNTISFGQFGVTGIVLGIFALIKKNLNLVKKGIVIVILLLCTFCMLRAGSRGPILALFFILLFWLFSSGKNLFRGILTIAFAITLAIVFLNQILGLMGDISPVIEKRLRMSIYEGDNSGRSPLFSQAINAFFDSPIIGKQFAIFSFDGSFIYSHNIILDALMGLGIVGAGILLYFLGAALKKSYFLINKNNDNFWICLIFIQLISSSMTSSCFYYDQLLSALLTFLFLYYRQTKVFNRRKIQRLFMGLGTDSNALIKGTEATKQVTQFNS